MGEKIRLDEYLERLERRKIRRAIKACANNVTQAAALLGITFRSLRYRMIRLGIKQSQTRSPVPYSKHWPKLRYAALSRYGNRCQCCGSAPGNGATLHVDHIKPRSKYPELAEDLDNLQVLCSRCHQSKGVNDETDWRQQA